MPGPDIKASLRWPAERYGGKLMNDAAINFKKHRGTAVLFLLFIASYLMMGMFMEGFGKLTHFAYLLQLSAFLGIASAGQTLVILTGGIDLSIGSSISFCSVFFALMLEKTGLGLGPVLALTLAAGILLGFINAMGVSCLQIPALVMTLATLNIYKGAALVITRGTSNPINQPEFEAAVNNRWFLGFSGVVFVWVVTVAAVVFLLRKTVLGRKVYYIGSNPMTAAYAGINERAIKMTAFILCGLSGAIAGILLTGFTGKSYFGIGDVYQFTSIAAVVVGGTSISGGKGGYMGTVAGALLITVIQNILILLRLPYGGQMAVQGLIILVLVIIYRVNQS